MNLLHEFNIKIIPLNSSNLLYQPSINAIPLSDLMSDIPSKFLTSLYQANILYLKQLLNNNSNKTTICTWNQITANYTKRKLKEPPDFMSFASQVLKKYKNSVSTFISYGNPFNPFTPLTITTLIHSFITANINHQNSKTNIISRLSKKCFYNDNLIFLTHYKQAKNNSHSPIVPCEGCHLSLSRSQIDNLKTIKPCIIQTDHLNSFTVPIRTLNKSQRQ